MPRSLKLAMLLAMCGCAAQPARPDLGAEPRRVVEEMVGDYQSRRNEAFFEHLDRGAFPHVEAFRERVRDFLLRNDQINIDSIIDAVIEQNGQVAVQMRWNRSFVDGTGAHRLEDGRCEIVMRRRPSGGWAVTAILGDSPF